MTVDGYTYIYRHREAGGLMKCGTACPAGSYANMGMGDASATPPPPTYARPRLATCSCCGATQTQKHRTFVSC